MSSKQKRPATRWASAAVVIGSVGAVLASPILLGTAAAAPPPQTVSSVTITSSPQTVASTSPATATATVSGTYVASADNGGDPGVIQYTVTNGGDQSGGVPAGSAGTLCTSARTNATSGTFSCSVSNTSHAAATDLVQVFSDTNASGNFNAGDAAGATSTTTVTFSGPPTGVSFTTAPTTGTTGTCAVYTAHTTGGNGAGNQPLTLTVTDTTTAASAANPISLYNAACTSVVSSGGNATAAGGTSTYTTTVTTASDGTISFGIASDAAGTGSVELLVPSNAAINTGAAPVVWSAGGANSVTTVAATPTSTTQLTNTTASFTVTATNGSSPVQGVTIREETDPAASPANVDTVAPTSCGTTNASGQVTCTVHNGGTAGADKLIFWVDNTVSPCGAGHTAGPDSCEPQGTATATFNATPAVDPGHSSLTCVQQLAGVDKGAAKTNCTLPTSQTSVVFTATVEDATGTPIANAPVTFTATSAKLGGIVVAGPSLPSGTVNTGANGIATFTVNNPTPVAADNVVMGAKVGAISIGTDTVTWSTPVATSLAVAPPLQTVTVGGVVTVKATINDQFGTAVSGPSTATYFVTGRNNAKTGSAAADGTITYTDAGTSPLVKTDSIQVTSGAFTGTADVVYVTGTTTATSVVVDSSGLGVSDPTCAATGHVAATGVALQGTTQVCALVKNATGEALAGKTVNFTVSNGQVAAHSGLTTTSGTTYAATTDAAGVAFADVTSTKSGAQTVTATADAASGTGTVTYLGPTPAQAYKIVVAPTPATINPGSGQKFTATVTDKFGNPVPGVTVVYTQSGTGTVGSGSGGTTITASDGTASVTVNTVATDTGSGSVTFNIGSASTVPANQCATTGGVCSAVATYTVAATGANLTISVETGAKVGTHESIHAVVTNAGGTPAANAVVRFFVQGANNTSGAATTGALGHATFSYLASHHGTDQIGVYVDSNNDQIREANEPTKGATAHIKGIEKPTITLSSTKGKVTVHVTSHPIAKGATVHYFVKHNGSWVKIGTNKTGHLGKAGKTFKRDSGKHLTFRAKVMTTPVTTTGTSSAKSVTVK